MQPADIKLYWDDIRDKVAQCCGGNGRPEDVYAACVYGDAQFFTNGGPDFFVLKGQIHPKTYQTELWIWIGYSELKDAFAEYMPWLEGAARAINAETLSFCSERRGFERRLGPEWRVREVTYEKDILPDYEHG